MVLLPWHWLARVLAALAFAEPAAFAACQPGAGAPAACRQRRDPGGHRRTACALGVLSDEALEPLMAGQP